MKKTLIYSAVCSLMLAGGCSLDREYLNGPYAGKFPANESEALSGLLAAYKNLTLMDASSTPFPGIQDNMTDIGAARINSANYTSQLLSQTSTQSALVEKLFSQIYKGAGRVHLVLDGLDDIRHMMTEEDYHTIKAELLLVRDYYYDLGCQMWGDIPFIDHGLTLYDTNISRTPRKQVIERILFEDLTDELLDWLPIRHDKEEWGTGRLGRVGAYGLKARIALNWGYYELAAVCADKALTLADGVYSLVPFDKTYCGKDHTEGEPSVANLFGLAGKNNDEMIWALQYNTSINSNQHNAGYYAAPRIAGGCSYFGPTQNLIDAFQCTDGKSISESSLYDYRNPWKNRDPRLDLFCVRPGSRVLGLEFQTAKGRKQIMNYNTGKMVANSEGTGTKSEFGSNGTKGPAGYLWRKYIDMTELKNNNGSFGTKSVCVINYPLMRLAELYLIRAEANIMMDGGNLTLAKSDIEQVRSRAGMPALPSTDPKELLKALRYERMVELCNEGFRWFDIRRWDIAEKVVTGTLYAPANDDAGSLSNAKPAFDDNWHAIYDGTTFDGEKLNLRSFIKTMYYNPLKDKVWPIPEAEIIANPAMEQNPFY